MHTDPAKELPCSHQLRATGSSASQKLKNADELTTVSYMGTAPDPLPADNVVVSISYH